MTNTEINEKVARLTGIKRGEELGYTHAQRNLFYRLDEHGLYLSVNGVPGKWTQDDFNPASDLNACAEAEATMTDEQHLQFRLLLWAQIDDEIEDIPVNAQNQERAYQSRSALQRCLAFIAVMESTKASPETPVTPELTRNPTDGD